MKQTYQDFIDFSRAFEEQNCFEFTGEIQQPDPERPLFFYDATYRDEGNYKTNVQIQFDGAAGVITWEIAGGWEDAEMEIRELYRQLFEKESSTAGRDGQRCGARLSGATSINGGHP